jgi:hypothetical protein
VKQSKLMLTMEAAYVAYMVAILWFLFPQWHRPVDRVWRSLLWQWRLGQAQLRLAQAAPWVREAAVVRGRLAAGPPRPFNFPE